MLYINFIVSALFVICALPKYYRLSNGFSLVKLNIYSYFFYSTVILTIMGAFILGINIDSHYLGKLITKDSTAMIGLLLLTFTFWFFAFLSEYFTKIKFFKSVVMIPYRRKINDRFKFSTLTAENNFTYLFTILLSISLISVIYTFIKIGFNDLPILNFFKGVSTEYLSYLRQKVGRGFTGNVYIRNILALGLTPLLSYVAFVQYFIRKEKKWFILFLISTILAIFILTYDLQKAPLLRYLFAYIFIIPHVYRGNIKLKLSYILLFIMLIAIMFLTLTSVSFNNLFSFNTGPLNRVFKTQAFSTFAHIDVFPSQINYLNGLSLPTIFTKILFGSEQVRSARAVMEIFNPDGIAAGTAGVMNGFYIAEAYANFSYLGVIISSLIVSFEMLCIHSIFLVSKKNPVSVAGYAYGTNIFVNTTQGGFIDFLYNPGLWFSFLIIVLLYKVYSKERS